MENRLFDYTPPSGRAVIRWPNGARVAFWVGVNIEYYEMGKPSTSMEPAFANMVPDPLNYGWRDYGVRVGVYRLMKLLDTLGVRGSVLLNSDVCRHYPEIIEEGRRRGWVWLAHGKNNSTLEAGMRLREERRYLKEVVGTIRRETGHQPRGWLGPALSETLNTLDILAELGVNYVCDWCNDDQPYPMNVKEGKMISIPYSVELNDVEAFLTKGMSGSDYLQSVKDTFDLLYEEGEHSGKVMCLPLHPFITSQPLRHRYLAEAIGYVAGHENVWVTTSDEIADWYYEHYYGRVDRSSGKRGKERFPRGTIK